MAITNNPHGFAPAFDVDPYHDPRLDSTLQKPVVDKFWVDDASANKITGNFTVQPIDTIQGQMITAQLDLDELHFTIMNDTDIKSRLIHSLCMELLSAKCIEFTKQHGVATNTIKVRARIFATPDTQIRVIRNATK